MVFIFNDFHLIFYSTSNLYSYYILKLICTLVFITHSFTSLILIFIKPTSITFKDLIINIASKFFNSCIIYPGLLLILFCW